MNDLVALFLSKLGMASLFLTVTGVVALVALRAIRCSSPLVHRVTWCIVLAQGVLFVQLPLQIPWDVPTVFTPTSRVAISADEIAVVTPAMQLLETNTPNNRVNSSQTFAIENNWANLLCLVWVGGIVIILGRWMVGYAIFVRNIESQPCDREEWCNEWNELLVTSREANPPTLHVSASVGPILCRLPSGYRVIVPFGLWQDLPSEQRTSILRHELAHFERRDIVKTLAANLLALLHWFNPMAWFASRRFEDSVEWTCDDQVRASEPSSTTNYAKALLAIGEYNRQKSAWSTAVFGGGFADRIRRVLSEERQAMSRTSNGTILGLLVACVALHVFQVELVAQNPEKPKAVSGVSTFHKDFFVVPLKTDFQKWHFKGFTAYANINLISLLDKATENVDVNRFDLDALQEALKKVTQGDEGKLMLHLDNGTSNMDEKVKAVKVNFEKTAVKSGFNSFHLFETYSATNDRYGLSESNALESDEPQLGNEQVIVFPIRTPLSRTVISGWSAEQVNCYIETSETVSLDSNDLLTDSDKDVIRQAAVKMTIPDKGVVKIQIHLQKPKTTVEISGLAQMKMDSLYHRDPTEFLKSLGFKKVIIAVNCDSVVYLSTYE